MGRKYTVKVSNNNLVKIIDTKTGKDFIHNIKEFIYGQIHYNEKTDKYPNYVHADVWKQDELIRRGRIA